VEFSIKALNPGRTPCDCIVIGVFADKSLSPAGAALDSLSKGAIQKVIASGDMNGQLTHTLLLHAIPNVSSQRVILVGLGSQSELNTLQYQRIIHAAVSAVAKTGAKDVQLHLTDFAVAQHDLGWRSMQVASGASLALYQFTTLKSKPSKTKNKLKHFTLGVAKASEVKAASVGVGHGLALAQGMSLARDLGNLPGNICTPNYLAEQARILAKQHKLKVQILNRAAMAKLGMNTLLSVAQGSDEPPQFIVLEYLAGPKSQKPVVLVGKGVTFDTGGISIKPAAEMDEMKYDMSGAGSVLGTLKTIASMKLAINVIGIIPATENMPSGRATKPGDVVTSMSGQTVEILNTDAEGRLILCDALTYAERYQPAAVIDMATLTGACVIALGHVVSGLFANNEALAQEILSAGQTAGDRAWQLPLLEDYQDQLHSNFADFANIGGRPAGAVTAACFLARFTKKYPWAHLDIAGTAWKSGKEKGSTGRPVPLLTAFLMQRAGRSH
jgi:leucyl aminopeptidase